MKPYEHVVTSYRGRLQLLNDPVQSFRAQSLSPSEGGLEVKVDRLRRTVGTFWNVIIARWACKLLKMWWSETGSLSFVANGISNLQILKGVESAKSAGMRKRSCKSLANLLNFRNDIKAHILAGAVLV
jgi:hypothetical protein